MTEGATLGIDESRVIQLSEEDINRTLDSYLLLGMRRLI